MALTVNAGKTTFPKLCKGVWVGGLGGGEGGGRGRKVILVVERGRDSC